MGLWMKVRCWMAGSGRAEARADARAIRRESICIIVRDQFSIKCIELERGCRTLAPVMAAMRDSVIRSDDVLGLKLSRPLCLSSCQKSLIGCKLYGGWGSTSTVLVIDLAGLKAAPRGWKNVSFRSARHFQAFHHLSRPSYPPKLLAMVKLRQELP